MSEVEQQMPQEAVYSEHQDPGKPISIEVGKIQKIEDNVEELRKIFVGGLNRETSDEEFKEYFSRYGEVVDSVIIRDNQKQSKGFGFVTFGTIEATDACIKDKALEAGHEISGKKIDIKRAIPKEFDNSQHGPRDKLFLGGIKDGINEDILGMYFEQVFGIREKSISLKRDNDGKLKGFGFLTVEGDSDDMLKNDIVDKIAIIQRHSLNGTQFDTKKAVPKNEGGGYGRSGGYGGGRGGYGNYGGYNNNNYDNYGGGYNNNYGNYQNTWNTGGGRGGRGGQTGGNNRYQPY